MTRIETYPSLEFEKISNIENLSKEWIIKFDIEKYRMSGTHKSPDILYFYNTVVEYNSILADINVITNIDRMNLIEGVISKFNYDDIKFFTENYNIISKYNLEMKDIYDNLNDYYGIMPEWVISPYTLLFTNILKICNKRF